ncbi:uncharacterized protein TNIN_140371 [Trichonephila inaurata madagascariensis]|uniref:CUB domain-containing protein n=1 Tax=Trichonephila inaurata madagascariensis TaxID=2747483 RepID=A0A8X7BTW2_9ARAC|nr:uncharacterized protein TNIN_140371 [Trichonephila inaurata madagascariensis]
MRAVFKEKGLKAVCFQEGIFDRELISPSQLLWKGLLSCWQPNSPSLSVYPLLNGMRRIPTCNSCHLLITLKLLWCIQVVVCYIHLDVAEFAKSEGDEVILNETGPGSSVIVRVSAHNLTDTVALTISSVNHSYIMVVFEGNVTVSNCSYDGSHVIFNNGSLSEFCVYNSFSMVKNSSSHFHSPDVRLEVITETESLNFNFTATVTKKFEFCVASQFICAEGLCTSEEFKCDGINNCGDNSDEQPGWPSYCVEGYSYVVPAFILSAAVGFLTLLVLLIFFIVCYIMNIQADPEEPPPSPPYESGLSTGAFPPNEIREAMEILRKHDMMMKQEEAFERDFADSEFNQPDEKNADEKNSDEENSDKENSDTEKY